MDKLDLTKQYKDYYTAENDPELIEIGEAQFVTITGRGEPAGKEFVQKTQTLYPVAHTIKKMAKSQRKDFVVPKLEGLWWVDSDEPPLSIPRSEWYWKLLIRMPDFVTQERVTAAAKEVLITKKLSLATNVTLEKLNEGKAVQILHVGPYETEPETIRKMDALIAQRKLTRNGIHHEIYLSDPNKTRADNLRTILRQPVK